MPNHMLVSLGKLIGVGSGSQLVHFQHRLSVAKEWHNTFDSSSIGHFRKYHNTLCLFLQILHEHCFQFLLKKKFGGTNQEHYGIFRSGLYSSHSVAIHAHYT